MATVAHHTHQPMAPQLLTHEFIDWVVVVESDEGESSGDSVLFHNGAFLDSPVLPEVVFQIVSIDIDIFQAAHKNLLNLDIKSNLLKCFYI